MWKKWIRRGTILLAAAFVLNIAFYLVYPDISRLQREQPGKTAFMEYREGQWRKAGIKRGIRQEWTSLSRISPYAVKAVIIAEDDKFWAHEGFDFAAIQKAIEKDLQQKRFKSGGSTISQQLVKNLYLTPAKTPIRKLKEAILTWRLERTLAKRRIIELYLNVAEWGEGIFGIGAAARHYFGKSADALTAREAAALAVVLPSPLRYNPVNKGRYVASRTEAVYRIMVRRGIVIPEYQQLLNEPPEASPDSQEPAGHPEIPEDAGPPISPANPQEGESSNDSSPPGGAAATENGPSSRENLPTGAEK